MQAVFLRQLLMFYIQNANLCNELLVSYLIQPLYGWCGEPDLEKQFEQFNFEYNHVNLLSTHTENRSFYSFTGSKREIYQFSTALNDLNSLEIYKQALFQGAKNRVPIAQDIILRNKQTYIQFFEKTYSNQLSGFTKKLQQSVMYIAHSTRQPSEKEYGIPIVQSTEQANESRQFTNINPLKNDEEDFKSQSQPQTRTHKQIQAKNSQKQRTKRCSSGKGSEEESFHHSPIQMGNIEQSSSPQKQQMKMNVLPDNIFSSLTGKIQELPEVNRDKNHPAWKQVRSQRKSEISTQRKQEIQSGQFVTYNGSKGLNVSLDRANSFGPGRSPYHPIANQSAATTLVSQQHHQQDPIPNRQQPSKILNNSLSIENERNRIQDVVNSSCFGPNYIVSSQNGLFSRADCSVSPMYRQSNEQDFVNNSAASKHPATVSRVINSNNYTAKSGGAFGDESGTQVATSMTPFVKNSSNLPLPSAITQSTSSKGIPQLNSNMQNLATQIQQHQQMQAQVNLSRGLYQTTQNNPNKYNFITPMVLSDLHQISSIQQTKSEFTYDELKYEEKKVFSPGGRQSNAPRIEYESSLLNAHGTPLNQEAKMALKSANLSNNNGPRQKKCDGILNQQTPISANYDGRIAPERNLATNTINSRPSGDALRPYSGQQKRQISKPNNNGALQVQHQKIISNAEANPSNSFKSNANDSTGPTHQHQHPNKKNFSHKQQSVLPASFVQKRRHLKTPGALVANPSSISQPPPSQYNNQLHIQQQNNLRKAAKGDKSSHTVENRKQSETAEARPFQKSYAPDCRSNDGKTVKMNRYMPSDRTNPQQTKISSSDGEGSRADICEEVHTKNELSKHEAHLDDQQQTTADYQGRNSNLKKQNTPKVRGIKSRNVKAGRTTHQKKQKSRLINEKNETTHANSTDLILSDSDEGEELAQSIKQETEMNEHLINQANTSPMSIGKPLAPHSSLQYLTEKKIKTEAANLATAECRSSSSLVDLHEDDHGWSIASIHSSCLTIDYQNTFQTSDCQKNAVTKASKEKNKTAESKTSDTKQNEFSSEREKQDTVESKLKSEPNRASVDQKQQEKKIDQKKQDNSDNDYFNAQKLAIFNKSIQERDKTSNDPFMFARQKVLSFLVQNPLNQRFLQKEKGKLPYSVFKPHASQVTFLKSIFEGRPPVAFFQYPSYVGIKRVADRIRMYTREEVEHLFMSFRISDSAHIYNAVVNSCKAAGLTMLESNNTNLFNLQWTGYIGANDIKHLNKYQKTNHFPGSSQLGRKDLLWRNMSRMRSKFSKDFVITPMSYLIQEEYEAFNAERERDPSALWILKPVAASCGRGIKIYNSTQRVSKKEGYLAAKYIANPHLLNGLKYDMRVYVLVTSFNPLRIYMYNDGLVRFATEKYSNDPRKLQKKYMHLTNFSINKKNMNFVKNKDVGMAQLIRNKQNANQSSVGTAIATADEDQQEFDQNQSKWDFKMLRMAYEKQGINYEYVIAQFKDLIVKTLLCVEPHITQNLQKNPTSRINCFELYGFDILVDSNQKPWVLEVNVLPSLSSSSPFDKRIKTMLICDTLTLVGIRGYDKQKFHSQTTELLGLAPFAQSMTMSELRQKPRLTGHERLTKDELEMLMDLDEEFMRRGNFQRIFPLASNAAFYDQFFETKRYQNALCASYLTSPQHIRDQLLSKFRRIYNSQV